MLKDLAKEQGFQFGSFVKLMFAGRENLTSLNPLIPPLFIKLNMAYPFKSPVFSFMTWLFLGSSLRLF